ncbi:YraN family protein [bacterium]|nr:YraN family protein [bacterium]
MCDKPLIKGRSQYLGYKAEYNVIKLLQSRAWNLQFHRLKTEIAEVDLIFEKSDQVLLLEVKTLNNSWRAFDRIHANQLRRMQNNLLFFRKKFRQIKFRAYVVWVSPENKISFVEVS